MENRDSVAHTTMKGVRHMFMMLAVVYAAVAMLWASDNNWAWSGLSVAGAYVCYMMSERWRERS